MRPPYIFVFGTALWALSPAADVRAQAAAPPPARAAAGAAAEAQIVDGIVAHIEDDIITWSEIHELAAYQELIDGRAQTNEELRSELIEQWMVNDEATAAHFPLPAQSEVDREFNRVVSGFAGPAAFQRRLAEVGLTQEALRRTITRQIYLARYLDDKFRSSVQVDDSAISNYYRDHLEPELKAKGQPAPPLAEVTEEIRELLIEQGVSDRTAAWFDETKPRLKIELEPMDALSLGASGGRP